MSQVLLENLRSIATALGISTEGKSAEDLSALIKGATEKTPIPSPSLADPWDALPKHFEEGRFTDCTIRVKLGEGPKDESVTDRPAKRLRSQLGEASGAEAPADEEGDGRVIKAHAVILASRSAYFDRAMGGEWRESQARSFEVVVADEQEYMTFRRLIKLCYGSTFIKEGDRDLDFSELVRLIHVANAFECMDAVKQCTSAIQGGELDLEGAVQCIELANMLDNVDGMAGLAEKGGGVIAKEVGPVHELFVPADGEEGADVLGGLRLSEKVKNLSPTSFEALISSEGLQLKTENEAFWLLLAWVEAQSEESEEYKQALFTRMAKHLFFDAMDPGYVLLLVSKHPRIIAAGLQENVLWKSLVRSNLARRTPKQVVHMKEDHDYELSSGRAPLGQVSWIKDATFTATDIASVTSGSACEKTVGLVAGTPWIVQLCRAKDDKMAAGPEKALVYTGCKPPRAMDSNRFLVGPTGFFFSRHLKAGAKRSRGISSSAYESAWTNNYVYGGTLEAWEEVFREGSEWLREGQLDVNVTITTCNDQ